MPEVKVTTWNIEHMHDWFEDTKSHVVQNFDGIATKVGKVIKTVKPHILCIQEGPNRKHQMLNFMDDFVGGQWKVFRSDSGGTQCIYIVCRDFPGLQNVEEVDFIADAWKYPFMLHSEKTGVYSHVNQKFTRLPVELIFHTNKGAFSVASLHLKSKISFVASNAKSSDPKKRTLGIAEGLEQRARILQEAKLLRDYVQNHPFHSDVQGRTIFAGDLNDGPGQGFFEERFFGTDIMRRIRGDVDHLDRLLTDVVDRGAFDKRFTAVFFDKLDKKLRRLLLDHILVPPQFLSATGLRVDPNSAKVEHSAYLSVNVGDWSKKTKPKRKDYPSDHRPASVLVRF